MASTVGQVIKCKAAVAWKAREPLVIEEVEVAPPKEMEVRIKILFTSLCNADVYCWKDKAQKQIFPRILGHEAGGIVESIGEGVTDIAPGDHVLLVFTGECRESSHCNYMKCIMCSTLRNITKRDGMIKDGESRFSINEKPIYQFVGISTFIEYTVVNVDRVAKIDLQAPLDIVCILSCGISTGLSAALNVAKPPWGSTVAIFGLGDVGLAAAEGARIAGASRIIGIDMNPERLKKAKKLGGFNDLVNPFSHERPIQEVLVEMTNGGVDRSIECTGNTSAMISAFECTHDGRVVLVGVPDKDVVFQTHSFNLLDEGILERKIFRYKKPRYDLSMLVELYHRQDLDLEKFITHEVPFSEINKAFDYMLHGDSIRCIIHMDA